MSPTDLFLQGRETEKTLSFSPGTGQEKNNHSPLEQGRKNSLSFSPGTGQEKNNHSPLEQGRKTLSVLPREENEDLPLCPPGGTMIGLYLSPEGRTALEPSKPGEELVGTIARRDQWQ